MCTNICMAHLSAETVPHFVLGVPRGRVGAQTMPITRGKAPCTCRSPPLTRAQIRATPRHFKPFFRFRPKPPLSLCRAPVLRSLRQKSPAVHQKLDAIFPVVLALPGRCPTPIYIRSCKNVHAKNPKWLTQRRCQLTCII